MGNKVLIVMGSDSDLPVMQAAIDVLGEFGVETRVRVCSAHRTPTIAHALASGAAAEGFGVIIAGAGMAAHLAGVFAASTILPVVGVPIDAGPLQGVDALYSTSQMPPGVPVATMGIGKAGAKNAGLFAVQVLATADPELASRFQAYKTRMAEEVEAKDRRLQERLGGA